MTSFADKRHVIECFCAFDNWHESQPPAGFTRDQILFAADLVHAGMLEGDETNGWRIERSTLAVFRGLRRGMLRQLGSSARLDVLQDHDLIRRKGALWQWAWIE